MRQVTFVGLLVLCCVSAFTAGAQDAVNRYISQQCIKVLPGKEADYEKYVAAISKPTAQARANAGEFAARMRFRAVYGGTEATCDYLLTDIYDGFPPDPTTAMSRADAQKKAGLTFSEVDALAMRDASIRLRKTELWRVREATARPAVGNFVRIDHMKVPDVPVWLKSEREIWMPAHKARVEMGALGAWAMFTLTMPSGSSLPYNAMTANVYSNWSQIGGPTKYAEAFKKTQPNADLAELGARAGKMREIVRSDVYKVVDVITPKK